MTSLGDEYTPAEARTNRVFDRLTQRIGAIIMSAAEDAATAVADQLEKARTEITTQNTELQAVIADLQERSVEPDTIARLQAVSQALDDLNPDAPVT